MAATHVINLMRTCQMEDLAAQTTAAQGASAAFEQSSWEVIWTDWRRAAPTTATPVVTIWHVSASWLWAALPAWQQTMVRTTQWRPRHWNGWCPGCGHDLIWSQLCGELRQRSWHEAFAPFLLHRVIFLWFSMEPSSLWTCDSERDASRFTCFQPVCTYRPRLIIATLKRCFYPLMVGWIYY